MKTETKLGLNFGLRGWMLLVFEMSALFTFQAFSNFPMNMLADFYGGAEKLSSLYTIGSLVGIALQLILSAFIPKIKSIKTMTLGLGALTLVSALGIMALPVGGSGIWLACYFLFCVVANMYGMFGIGIIVGQWFPTRKGVFMGIATFAFPICNGLMGPFANTVYSTMATTHSPNVLGAFLPFFLLALVGWLIGLIFIKDYPEQVGCYRDNDKSFTKEKADAMMQEEIENKKTTVWKPGATLKSGQFWLITIPTGTLLMCSVGMMTQTQAIIGAYESLNFNAVMGMVMIFALIGSYVLGLVDGKWGTKMAVLVSEIIMLLSGILGGIGSSSCAMISIILLAVFMGAGSNFTVSCAAQYWRREDFPSVFSVLNPIANVVQCLGPMMVAITIGIGMGKGMGVTLPFWVTAIIAAISIVLILCFKPAAVKATDDKYRAKAGKPLDDALVGRK